MKMQQERESRSGIAIATDGTSLFSQKAQTDETDGEENDGTANAQTRHIRLQIALLKDGRRRRRDEDGSICFLRDTKDNFQRLER